MTQHAGLDAERWSRFDLDQQILMIANEMNRSLRFASGEPSEALRRGYERVLQLVDLTAATPVRRAFRRELLRWRGVVAELYLAEAVAPRAHGAALRALLLLRPAAARQIPLLPGCAREAPGSGPAPPPERAPGTDPTGFLWTS
jgi:hypothetical protein